MRSSIDERRRMSEGKKASPESKFEDKEELTRFSVQAPVQFSSGGETVMLRLRSRCLQHRQRGLSQVT